METQNQLPPTPELQPEPQPAFDEFEDAGAGYNEDGSQKNYNDLELAPEPKEEVAPEPNEETTRLQSQVEDLLQQLDKRPVAPALAPAPPDNSAAILQSLQQNTQAIGVMLQNSQQGQRSPIPGMTNEEALERFNASPQAFIASNALPIAQAMVQRHQGPIIAELRLLRDQTQEQMRELNERQSQQTAAGGLDKMWATVDRRVEEFGLEDQLPAIEAEIRAILSDPLKAPRYLNTDPRSGAVLGDYFGELVDAVIGRRGKDIQASGSAEAVRNREERQTAAFAIRPGGQANPLGAQRRDPASFEEQLFEHRRPTGS